MRYFIEFSYHGKNYHGWQTQPDANSVQQEVNNSISTVLQKKIEVVGAGRTDTGVHAEQMYAHFDVEKKIDSSSIYRFNSLLPSDIVISRLFPVADTQHARFDAIRRSYEYRIWLGRNPFLLDLTWQLHQQRPSLSEMNKAASLLLEYENFQCFSKVKTEVKTFRCTVTNAVWKQEKELLVFCISADRFLRNMVRAIVGTLLEVGLGKMSTAGFREVILSKDRSNAGLSVPAKGLFLTEIKYAFDE